MTETLCVVCSASGAPGGPLWGAWWQRGPSRAAGAFERLDAVLETYTDVTRFPRWGPDRRGLRLMCELSLWRHVSSWQPAHLHERLRRLLLFLSVSRRFSYGSICM